MPDIKKDPMNGGGYLSYSDHRHYAKQMQSNSIIQTFSCRVEWACAKFGGRVILSHLFFKTITLSDNLYKNNAMHDDNEFEGMVVVSRK